MAPSRAVLLTFVIRVFAQPPLGEIECTGSSVLLKAVSKGGTHRFTLRTPERDLKLRAPDAKICAEWVSALKRWGLRYGLRFAELEEESDSESVRSASEDTSRASVQLDV